MSRRHFALKRPCGLLAAVPLPAGEETDDPVEIMRRLPERDRNDLLGFWRAHESHGEPEPAIVEIEPVAEA